jgi:adenylate cyclase
MAHVFRSISFKIFSISLGLLIMMVAAASWSAHSTEQVHRQLRTLEYALFPLAETMANLETVVQAQRTTADFLLVTPDDKAVQHCLTKARSQGKSAKQLLTEAEKYRAKGAEIAVLERNKLALARIQPIIAEISYQQDRLSKTIVDACARDADALKMNEAKIQADEVFRLSASVSAEIDTLVGAGARIVADNQETALRATMFMIGSAALVGLMLAWLISRGMTRPILRLQAGARAVGAGMLDDAHVPVTSRDEIGDVTHAFNGMINDLREKERIKETFGQYVDPRIVAGLIDGAQHSSVGEKQVATLFFSDIVGFTSIAERLAPSTLVDLMNGYFSAMSQPIRDQSGIIDKYIGDAIMAFWVPPFVDATIQAEFACRAALDQFARLEAFRASVPDVIGLRRDVPLIDFRVGLSTGEVVVGSIGSDTARSFTVMGDAVNQASRIEAANKVYGTHLLIDQMTYSLAGSAIEARHVDDVVLAGRQDPIGIYELVALSGQLSPDQRALFDLYEEGLALYQKADWVKAQTALKAALEIAPQDGPSLELLSRIAQFCKTPPANWSGIWHMASK